MSSIGDFTFSLHQELKKNNLNSKGQSKIIRIASVYKITITDDTVVYAMHVQPLKLKKFRKSIIFVMTFSHSYHIFVEKRTSSACKIF